MIKSTLKIFLLAGAINTIWSDPVENLNAKISALEKANAELRERIERIESLLKKGEIKEDKMPESRAWLEPKMGWVMDYSNNRIYTIDTSGTGQTMNVGIGTSAPQSRFHLLGDFYNQGFTGVKNNYNPGIPGWNNVTSRTITTHGTGEDSSVVLILAHVQQSCAGGYVDMFIRVIRDGSTVVGIADGGGYYDIYSGTYGYMGATLVTYDEPPSGSHTYTLQIENAFSGALGYNFIVLELKR
uniref:Uncharacterized protein n=1 Tax=candidate division WOR-3 bacterium TaxID=2052148 RepID=A0A7C4TBY3_UNCW3